MAAHTPSAGAREPGGDTAEEPPALRRLLERIENRTCVVGVMGLGYVGLPLANTFHAAGFRTLGFDTEEDVVASLTAGRSYLEHLPSADKVFRNLADSDRFSATTDMTRLGEVDAVMICVPTPLGKHFEPDLGYVESCGRSVAKTLTAGQLVILESTTYPGTTRERLLPILTEGAHALVVGRDLFLAFSPEREDPGNQSHQMSSIPKLVGGLDEPSGTAACALYRAAFESVLQVRNSEVAEAAKLVENIYRAVNIALVNELKMVLARMDIDIWEVLDAAETKPFGFHRFNPGPGWGGHCIPVDPFYLTWKARSVGMHSHFIEHAGEINIQMPAYVVQHVQSALNEARKPLNASKVLLLGIAYKPNIGDTRETPAFVIWKLLSESKADVSYYDPLVPRISGHLSEDLHFLLGKESVSNTDLPSAVAASDCIVVVTPHACFLPPLPAAAGRNFAEGAVATSGAGKAGPAVSPSHSAASGGGLLAGCLKGFAGPVVDTRNWIPKHWGLNVYRA